MIIRLIRYLLLPIIFLSCESGPASTLEPGSHIFPVSQVTEEQLLDLLNAAYSEDSDTTLNDFINTWQQDLPPRDENLLSEDQKAVYDVFRSVYFPNNPSLFGGSGGGDSVYNNISNFIIQDSIRVNWILENQPDSYWKQPFNYFNSKTVEVIGEFRPSLAARDIATLYLTSKYKNVLNAFVGSEPVEASERVDFLNQNNKLKITQSFSLRWFFETQPVILSIFIDQNLGKARVHFYYLHFTGLVFLKRGDQGWEIVYATTVGIT